MQLLLSNLMQFCICFLRSASAASHETIDTIENMDIVIQSTSKKHLASKLEDHRRVLGRLESDWLELYQPADYNPWDKGSKVCLSEKLSDTDPASG